MTEDVWVTIKGLHMAAADTGENVELVTIGKHSSADGLHMIEYEEHFQQDDERDLVVKNRLLIGNDRVELQKDGGLSMQMVFRKDFRSLSKYRLPYGTIDIAMEATEVQVAETEDQISVQLQYYLEMNGAHTSDCTMSISIQAR